MRQTSWKPLVVNSWQSHIPPISQTTCVLVVPCIWLLWIADKVISPLYHKQQDRKQGRKQSVVNSWQSHIPPISQTTRLECFILAIVLWIADKVISPLYHKQQRQRNNKQGKVVNSWQSHIPPISQTTRGSVVLLRQRLWIADKVISPLYHKQLRARTAHEKRRCE